MWPVIAMILRVGVPARYSLVAKLLRTVWVVSSSHLACVVCCRLPSFVKDLTTGFADKRSFRPRPSGSRSSFDCAYQGKSDTDLLFIPLYKGKFRVFYINKGVKHPVVISYSLQPQHIAILAADNPHKYKGIVGHLSEGGGVIEIKKLIGIETGGPIDGSGLPIDVLLVTRGLKIWIRK